MKYYIENSSSKMARSPLTEQPQLCESVQTYLGKMINQRRSTHVQQSTPIRDYATTTEKMHHICTIFA